MHVWPVVVLFVAAAFLSASDTGAIAIILAIATLFRPLLGLSLGRTSLRYIGQLRAQEGKKEAARFSQLIVATAFFVSIFGLLVVIGVMTMAFSIYQIDGDYRVLLMASALASLFSLIEVFDGVLRAEGRFGTLAAAMTFSRFIAFLCFLLILPNTPTLGGLISVVLFAEVVCIGWLSLAFFLSREECLFKGGIVAGFHKQHQRLRALLLYTWPVMINAIAVYLYARSMVLIVAFFEPPETVGGFEIAVQLTALPMAFTIVVASIISPRSAQMFQSGARSRAQLRLLLSQGASISLWFNSISMIFVGVFGAVILATHFPQFPNAPTILLLLSPLILIKAFSQILFGEVAVALGQAALTARITMVFGLLNVFFGVAAAYCFGALGAAIAMLIIHSVAAIVAVRVLSERTGLHLRYRALSAISGPILAAIPSIAFLFWLNEEFWLALALGALAFGFFYTLLLLASWSLSFGLHHPIHDARKFFSHSHHNSTSKSRQ
jgi:O-antigen/teichoic acid export membrane protein